MAADARVALATSSGFPHLDEDGALLVSALDRRGVLGVPAVWDDPAQDWSSYDLVVVRSTWDYFRRRDEFLAWAAAVGATTVLRNAVDVLRWNTDKTYLRDLAAEGLPVVSTTWLRPGDDDAAIRAALPASGGFVVKPAVSAGSLDTDRYVGGSHDDDAHAHAAALLAAGRTVMVQPYLEAVDSAGETAMLFVAGDYSHAIRKAAMLDHPLMGEEAGGYRPESITAREPSDAERAVAAAVLDALRWSRRELLYARVDLVPTGDGPVLLELEVAEPSMFLRHDDGAADRFAAAIAAVAASAGTRSGGP